ncbi:hypothetical protein [Streptomyces sp. ICBB 8177]|uniref:hypothetical protein n=1 Tax=Streptomyces sp. ICBB 8177 TaxID=563922 RepID=UPI000D6835CC|nr:hypothetical protein [Streptomyces sp. ICBB 8177]PWI42589.1 hypothetical protein CK485_09650 [Streptomyces sp. ICBB 8177]
MDHASHSITVNLRSAAPHELELLIDGKEVSRERLHGSGTYRLTGVLPDEPTHPFHVRVRESRMGFATPTCVIEIDGTELLMQERPVV